VVPDDGRGEKSLWLSPIKIAPNYRSAPSSLHNLHNSRHAILNLLKVAPRLSCAAVMAPRGISTDAAFLSSSVITSIALWRYASRCLAFVAFTRYSAAIAYKIIHFASVRRHRRNFNRSV
jgi:hypothetical protein